MQADTCPLQTMEIQHANWEIRQNSQGIWKTFLPCLSVFFTPLQYSCLENPVDRGARRSQRVRHDWNDRVCTQVHTHVRTCTCTRVDTRVCTRAHTCMCTHTHTPLVWAAHRPPSPSQASSPFHTEHHLLATWKPFPSWCLQPTRQGSYVEYVNCWSSWEKSLLWFQITDLKKVNKLLL